MVADRQNILNIADTKSISDEQEFIVLMQENQGCIYRLAFNLLGDAEEAKDATQETFVRAWKKLDILRRETSRAWLSKTTVNLCMDWLRKRKFKGDLPEDYQYQTPDPNPNPLEECMEDEVQSKVRVAISKLAPKYRTALILRDLEGMSYQEIADIMGMKISKVKSNIFRGREKLKDMLRPFFEVDR